MSPLVINGKKPCGEESTEADRGLRQQLGGAERMEGWVNLGILCSFWEGVRALHIDG